MPNKLLFRIKNRQDDKNSIKPQVLVLVQSIQNPKNNFGQTNLALDALTYSIACHEYQGDFKICNE